MKAAIRQKFTTEFREQAVKLITEQGLKISEVARRLDISDKPKNGSQSISFGLSRSNLHQQLGWFE